MIRFDIGNWDTLYVYDASGRNFLCEARPVRLVNPIGRYLDDVTEKTGVMATVKARGKLKQELTRKAKQVEALATDNPAILESVIDIQKALQEPIRDSVPEISAAPEPVRLPIAAETVTERPIFPTDRAWYEWYLKHPDQRTEHDAELLAEFKRSDLYQKGYK